MLHKDPERIDDGYEEEWRTKLQSYDPEKRGLTLTTLLAVFESDQNRMRGIEVKARGVLQCAGLVFTGSAVTLTLAFRNGTSPSPATIWFLGSSAIYLVCAVWAALYVDTPSVRRFLSVDDVLQPVRAGATLAVITRLNRAASIARTNLTESAIFDVARALVTAAVALVLTVLAI